MMRFFEILSFLLAWGYTAVFFLILKSFLPLRKNVVLKVIAFLVCGYLADSIIYSNDAGSLFGTMLLFFLYVLLFYRGTFMEKLSVILVFYPALIAINYLMLDTGGRLFKIVTLNTHAHQYSHSYGVPFAAVTVLDRCMVGFAEVFGKNSVPSEHKDMADY